MLEQLQLIAAGLHVDEVDDHHATDVAQFQLTGDLGGRLVVGPQHRLAGIGRAGEGARVDVNHRQGLGGLDDHVTARRQIHPRLEGIANGRVDLVVLQDLGGLAVVLHQHGLGIVAEERVDPGDRIRSVHHNPRHLRGVVVAQDPVDEIVVAVQQNRRGRGFSGRLDGFPLAQERLEVVDQQLFADAFGLGADQQACTGGLDQDTEGTQAVALALSSDPARDIHPLAMGLKHQEPARQGEISRQPRPLRSGGLLHHLNEHLLPGLQQLGDADGAFLQAKGTEVRDMNKAVLLTLTDVDEGGINARQDVLDRPEIHVTDLIATLCDDEFVDTLIGENSGNPQLLGDDDLLGHGRSGNDLHGAGRDKK